MSKTENSAPNIVLIVTDQQRWDTLGCLGYDHVITPHIDRLAARGVAFSRAFVQGAVCGPSRNSIVSGQYVHTHGIDRNEAWLTPDQPNWIEQLKDGGYHTVNIGKMHTFGNGGIGAVGRGGGIFFGAAVARERGRIARDCV
ncbi:MAG: sulfatase-like hydrolase/transferase, partial [Gemmatimonadetes bacterium]|nr:sulfatase-like hydrolase/transferase [Gemmatimonadota bacterium]